MRNLFNFIWKQYFFFLFLILQFFAFLLIISNNKFHNAGFFNSSNFLAGNIYKSFDDVTGYLNLKNANELLAAENARLLSSSNDALLITDNTLFSSNDSTSKQKYEYREAKVINNSINKRNNYLTLDKGSLHGIKPMMGIIAPDGVVGIVKDVSENFCSVISLLNKSTIISSKLKTTGYLGSVAWEGGDPSTAILFDIPKHAKIAIGDTIITSGASTIFPEGVLVGTIKDFNLKDGDNFYQIKINLTTDFGKLSYVYIVNNLLSDEQKQLELFSQNDN
jgi:rod shape-determining protein MreC